MKKIKKFLFIMLLLFPSIVFASSTVEVSMILGAIFMEAFVTIHMSLFVLSPLSKIFAKGENPKKIFWNWFKIRVGVLLFFDFFITPAIAILDFLAVFVGAFLVVPICSRIKEKKSNVVSASNSNQNNKNDNIILKCTKCNSVITLNHKFCDNCGSAIEGNDIKSEMDQEAQKELVKIYVKPRDFHGRFNLTEDLMIEHFLNSELVKAGLDKNSVLIPSKILKRRKVLNIIFSFLTFCLISLIFFHFPLSTYICGIIILFILYKFTKKYNFMKYLKKEIKSRPSEKISNIVMNLKQTMVQDTSNKYLFVGMIVSVILPLIIFIKPMIWYEKVDGGYGVRYYIFGLTNFTSATIPEKHNDQDVILLRGNTFSNMPLLKEVNLPDTIIEIRGQAFKNNKSLKTVNLPNNLTYLGGGAFYNCTSLESIEIPDSVSYMGGEAFYNAHSLKRVKLSKNLEEIRGSTFENCTSLESIEIPDGVTRIGGHAFYNNSSLKFVSIGPNSRLTEIGSSAFRRCNKLYEITIPSNVYVNERAFKESPTNIRNYDMADKNLYQYEKFIYIKVGESVKINEYQVGAIIQDESVTLLSIIPNNGLYEFTLNVNGQIFTLTNDSRYYEVNNNLVIEIEDDYVFERYYDKVSLYVYYN